MNPNESPSWVHDYSHMSRLILEATTASYEAGNGDR